MTPIISYIVDRLKVIGMFHVFLTNILSFTAANEIVETEDIQELCYESLSELFPGGGRKLLQRSKVWKIIQASLNVSINWILFILSIPIL